MADLTDLQASQAVKLIGSDSSGAEQTPVQSTAIGELRTVNIVNQPGLQGALSVSTTGVQVKVGGSNLANRTLLTALNNGTSTIYWGKTSSVTSLTGTPLVKNQYAEWDIGPNSDIYLIAVSGSHDIRITES